MRTTCYLINRVSTKSLGFEIHEKVYGSKPIGYSYLRVFDMTHLLGYRMRSDRNWIRNLKGLPRLCERCLEVLNVGPPTEDYSMWRCFQWRVPKRYLGERRWWYHSSYGAFWSVRLGVGGRSITRQWDGWWWIGLRISVILQKYKFTDGATSRFRVS